MKIESVKPAIKIKVPTPFFDEVFRFLSERILLA